MHLGEIDPLELRELIAGVLVDFIATEGVREAAATAVARAIELGSRGGEFEFYPSQAAIDAWTTQRDAQH
ncbi:hypothetical protein MOQ72_37380 [Saccharopolyspora sp. K220]|uniref:hypothetical protein n=1 Tax=Saccharopolyspora soli TaxID=2926618 RepID=UPI001F577D99|nr:hypothetical protein [Saccharopolyspora soli]MCI2423106.1 hypothetical protein [Saccharopolyspora soli]